MSKTIKESFITFVNEAYKNAECISDAYQKASVFASLAQSIALSGLLVDNTDMPVESGKDSLKPESGKGKKSSSKKSKSKNKAINDEIPVVETPYDIPEVQEETSVEESVETNENVETSETVEENTEDEISDEWNDETNKLKEESVGLLYEYVDSWTADYVFGSCIPAFFEDESIVANEDNWFEFIRPTNIDAFVTYLATIAEQQE